MKHTYVTCDRCNSRIEGMKFKTLTGVTGWELCIPCYDAVEAFIAEPDAGELVPEPHIIDTVPPVTGVPVTGVASRPSREDSAHGELEKARREVGIDTQIGVPTAESDAAAEEDTDAPAKK